MKNTKKIEPIESIEVHRVGKHTFYSSSGYLVNAISFNFEQLIIHKLNELIEAHNSKVEK